MVDGLRVRRVGREHVSDAEPGSEEPEPEPDASSGNGATTCPDARSCRFIPAITRFFLATSAIGFRRNEERLIKVSWGVGLGGGAYLRVYG